MAQKKKTQAETGRGTDANRDPITGAPGSHPVGTGVGAAAAGTAGAAIGAIGGPVGAVVGAAIGAIAGGLMGKGVAEAIDPTLEDAFWRDEYARREYVKPDTPYDTYQPAYRYGWEAAASNRGRAFEELEDDLGRDWETYRGKKTELEWQQARLASRDAYNRVNSSTVVSGVTDMETGSGALTGIGSDASGGAFRGEMGAGEQADRNQLDDEARLTPGTSAFLAAGAANTGLGSGMGAAGLAAAGALGTSSGSSRDWGSDWYREHWQEESYITPSDLYDDYEPAWRFGGETAVNRPDADWTTLEPEFKRDWDTRRGKSGLTWERAKAAVRSGWERARDAVMPDDDASSNRRY